MLLFVLAQVLISCAGDDVHDATGGPAICFMADSPQSKAFIDYINRSGNELVVYDQMSLGGNVDWYIDHERIRCTVDGQQVWDFVDSDEYFWLYGSSHKCFGWLFSGPSGFNTISFFGSHPEFVKDTYTLPLPAYEFTLESPIFDFLYSDITLRTYTQQNPDASPVPLKMNHLFSAFRFTVRNVRQSQVSIKSAKLSVVTRKKASIDFSGSDAAVVTYSEAAAGNLYMENSIEMQTMSASYNLFHETDLEAYHLMWAQDKTEFEDAVLEIRYSENGDAEIKTKEFGLKSFAEEWLSGQRYSYELIFTDKEIRLDCVVEPWDKTDITLDFTDVVVVADKIQWHNDTVLSIEEHSGQVILHGDGRPGECYFKIDAPTNATWYATLIPVQGAADAFSFVDPENPAMVLDTPKGKVGEIGKLMIKVNNTEDLTNTNSAKLRIMVKTADYRTIIVENLCSGHDVNEYTIIQNIK